MQLIEIKPTERADWRRFHAVSHYIYRNDPHWIAPLEEDIEGIFSNKNLAYREGRCRLWVLSNGQHDIGRIAAFSDDARNAQQDYPTGGIGFFDCVNDAAAARLLLGAAETYLRDLGAQAIDGPINFGERDKFWGLLTRGWYPPIYQENYHAPYYRAFFEDWGFRPNEQCLTLNGKITDVPIERVGKLAERVRERFGLSCRHITRENLTQGAYWFAEAYNGAFRHVPYFKPLTGEQILPIFQAMKPILDPYLTCIVFDGDKPVGLCGLIPELNEFFRGFGGRVRWYQLPQLLYRLRFQRRHSVKGIAFGVHVDYQRKGVFPLMIDFMYRSGNCHNARVYDVVDLATIRGHNDIMVESCRSMGVDITRVHIAYRKPLRDDLAWEPFKQLDVAQVSYGEVPATAVYPTT